MSATDWSSVITTITFGRAGAAAAAAGHEASTARTASARRTAPATLPPGVLCSAVASPSLTPERRGIMSITSTPGLLEREDELRRLRHAIAGASDGAGGLVVLRGPAGVGKTRLLARARSDAAAAGLSVLEARGAPLERAFAFGVARQLFEAPVLAEPEGLLSGAARLSERLFGDAGAPLEAQGSDAAFGALHGLYWLTANLADRGPLMLAVDDAQWADAPSL